MRGTTDESRRLGEGRPPEEQLAIFVRTFVRRLLEAGERGHPRIHRLFQRETTEPSVHLERIVHENGLEWRFSVPLASIDPAHAPDGEAK